MGNQDRVGAEGLGHTGSSWRFTPDLSDPKLTLSPCRVAPTSVLTKGMTIRPTNSKLLHLMGVMGIPLPGAPKQTPQMAGLSPVPGVREKADLTKYKGEGLRETTTKQQMPHSW